MQPVDSPCHSARSWKRSAASTGRWCRVACHTATCGRPFCCSGVRGRSVHRNISAGSRHLPRLAAFRWALSLRTDYYQSRMKRFPLRLQLHWWDVCDTAHKQPYRKRSRMQVTTVNRTYQCGSWSLCGEKHHACVCCERCKWTLKPMDLLPKPFP